MFLVAVLLAGLVPCAFADEAMPTEEMEASEAATEAAEETTAPPETAVPSESTEPPSETTEPPEATETTGLETEVTEPEADPVEDAPEDAIEDDRLIKTSGGKITLNGEIAIGLNGGTLTLDSGWKVIFIR